MIQKLEQYNQILEDVIDTLKSLSTPGGPNENTLLLVMGDHGQTLNGDHGGGTAEEVETSLFAWSPKTPPDAVLSVLGENSCNFDLVHFICNDKLTDLVIHANILIFLFACNPSLTNFYQD